MTDIRYSSSDGLSLYAKAYGPADASLTVLCMHGLTRNHKDFEPMIQALDSNARFICVDVRGRGESDRTLDATTYKPANYAMDMVALLDHLELERVALVGTSMGGLMSMVMARLCPGRIRGVVLNDVGPKIEQKGLDRIAAYAGKVEPVSGWSTAAAITATAQASAFPDYGDKDWLAFAHRTYRETPDGQLILDYDPAITQSLGEARPSRVATFMMWRLFSALKPFPLLVVRGETSDLFSPKTAARMVRRHPDAKLVTVPRRGHAPMLDEPVAVDAISTFLKRIEAQS